MKCAKNNNYKELIESMDESLEDLFRLTGDLLEYGIIDRKDWSILYSIGLELKDISEGLDIEMKKCQKQQERLMMQNKLLSFCEN